METFVSVIIPVRNGERYLADAIASVLNQNHTPLELVIVDDGSTDGTRDVVADAATHYGTCVHYMHQTWRGPSAARNLGISKARGDVISFLDHDDLWAPQCLPRHLAYLSAHPEIDIVQGLIIQMQRVPAGSAPDEFTFEVSSEPYQFISLSSAVYRKTVFERVGGCDEKLLEGEDADWFIRAWERNVPKAVLEDVMLYYRRHDTNLTTDSGPRLLPRLFKMHLDRLRAGKTDAGEVVLDAPRQNAVDYLGLPPRPRATRHAP
jgi:glycosyltransferase involved in cell wall biosynthesis